jgi:hypothetical protein
MVTVHKEVRQRASQQDKEWQDGGDMRAMPEDEIEGQNDGNPEDGPAPVRPETPEHDQAPS